MFSPVVLNDGGSINGASGFLLCEAVEGMEIKSCLKPEKYVHVIDSQSNL